MYKLGINLDAVMEITYEELLKRISKLGFKATFADMNYCDNIEHIAELCNANGIELSFIHAPYKGTNSIWCDSTDGDQMLNTLLSCVDRCSNIGVPMIVVHVTSGYTPPPISDFGANRFKKLVEHGKEKGIKIAFENLRVPEYLEWAMNTFKENNVGFCWDIGHENCFTEGIEYMPLYGDRLFCTHIHDNFKIHSGDEHIIPFDGKIDYKKAMRHIKNSSFTGPLMLEIYNRNKIYGNIPPMEFLRKAYYSLEKIEKLIFD